jgi:N-acetyl-anhydromuramyl-L-alanine amidase AmpD
MDVLHTTGGRTQSAINTVMNRANSVSYHFIIAGASFGGHGIVPALNDGDIFQMVDIANTAWHSGITAAVRNSAAFRNNAHPTIQARAHNPNQFTIGIGFGDMNLNGWRLTEAQIASYLWLTNHLQAERQRLFGFIMPLTRDHIIGHSQINPVNRPNCPGNIQWDVIMAGLQNSPQKPPNNPVQPPLPVPENLASWAAASWGWAIANLGMDGTRPTAQATRQEVMVLLHRLYNLLKSGK